MPSTSQNQHNAMEAAAHGDSKLGIPKKVGQEFAKADEKKGKKPFNAAKAKATVAALRKKSKHPLPGGMSGMEGEEGAM